MALDLSDDYAVFDGLETVTYFVRAAESTYAAGVSVPNALRRVVTHEDMASAGALLNEVGTVWHLWVSQLSGISPKVGDRIQDSDAKKWQVKKADKQTLGTRWRLVAVRER